MHNLYKVKYFLRKMYFDKKSNFLSHLALFKYAELNAWIISISDHERQL